MENKTMSKQRVAKFVYATAVTGQVIKIPLPDNYVNFENPGYFTQYLLDAGVKFSDLDYISFNITRHKSEPGPRSSFDIYADTKPPQYPVPKNAHDQVPLWSEVKIARFVSFKDMRDRRKQFCMKRVDGGFVSIFLYPEKSFVNNSEWKDLNSGNLCLSYGLAWKQQDRQLLSPGDSFTKKISVKEGMRKETELTIAASLGVSYAGVSAEISTTFRTNTTITEEKVQEETLTFSGTDGVDKVICTWQLAEVISIVRKESDGSYSVLDNYAITLKEATKGGETNFIVQAGDAYTMNNLGVVGAVNLTSRLDPNPTTFSISE